MFRSLDISTKTGFAPAKAIDDADAIKELGAVITSSSFFKSKTLNER